MKSEAQRETRAARCKVLKNFTSSVQSIRKIQSNLSVGGPALRVHPPSGGHFLHLLKNWPVLSGRSFSEVPMSYFP